MPLKMADLLKKLRRSGGGSPIGGRGGGDGRGGAVTRVRRVSEPSTVQPPCPPLPAISHLTREEIQILQDVFKKQEDFEKSHESYARRLEKELQAMEDRVRQQAINKSKVKNCDLRLCRLCFKAKFSDSIGRVCHDCHRRVCNKCGSFVLTKNKQSNKGRWRCYLCHKRREYACLTGIWFHGQEGRPSISSSDFSRKLSDTINWAETDWGQSDGNLSEGELADFQMSLRDTKTDSELAMLGDRSMSVQEDGSPRSCRRLVRRRTASADTENTHEEDEEKFVDANQFMMERRKCRQERLEQQRRASRRRGSRRGSASCLGLEDSGSNLDLSPDGRSQTSSMSEQSGQHGPSKGSSDGASKQRKRHVSAERRRPSSALSRGDKSQLLHRAGGGGGGGGGAAHGRDRPTQHRHSVSSHVVDQQQEHHREAGMGSYSRERHSRSTARRASETAAQRQDAWRRHRSQSASAAESSSASGCRPLSRHGPPVIERKASASGMSKQKQQQKGFNDAKESDKKSEAAGGSPQTTRSKRSSRPRRPSADASCQISEGDAPLAVIQRAAMKAAKPLSNDIKTPIMTPCRKHGGEILLGADLVFPGGGSTIQPPGSSSPQHRPRNSWSGHSPDARPRGRESSPSPHNSPYRRMSTTAVSSEKTSRRRVARQDAMSVHSSSASSVVAIDLSDDRESSPRRRRPSLGRAESLALPQPPLSPPAGTGSLIPDGGRHRKCSFGMDSPRSDNDIGRPSESLLERRVSGQSYRERVSGGSSREDMLSNDECRSPAAAAAAARLPERRSSVGTVYPSRTGSEHPSKSSHVPFERQTSWTPFHVKLHRDPTDTSCRTAGFGIRVMGGKITPDGTLGTFITSVRKGSEADRNGLRPGDQILEWGSQSLEDATFEEVRQAIDQQGDSVRLLAIHTNMDFSKDKSESGKESNNIPHWHSKSESRRSIRSGPPARGQKRLLPKTPVDKAQEKPHLSSRLNMQLTHDVLESRLTVGLLRCRDLPARNSNENEAPQPFAKVLLLPDRCQYSPKTTLPAQKTRDPIWNVKFVYDNIGKKEVSCLAVEVTVWDARADSGEPPTFLGEVLLDLSSSHLDGSEVWYHLQDHDENNGPLPSLEGGCVDSDGQTSGRSSVPSLPRTPAHDWAKKLLDKRPSSGSRTQDSRTENLLKPTEFSESSPQLYKRVVSPTNAWTGNYPGDVSTKKMTSSTSHPENLTHQGGADGSMSGSRPTLKVRVMRQMSEVVSKVGAKLADKRSHSLDADDRKTSMLGVPEEDKERRHSHSGVTGSHRKRSRKLSCTTPPLNIDLLSPPMPVSRSSSQSSGSNFIPTATESDFDDSCYSPTYQVSSMDDSAISTHLGQVAPKSPTHAEGRQLGSIQLGLAITKGQMEVDVVRARGLSCSLSKGPPDTYVKTCLLEGKRRFQRKKTKSVKGTCDPMYRHQIKYAACNIHGRHLLVQVREKTKNFEKSPCLGEVIIRLDSLDLSRKTSGWYQLFKQSDVEIGSTESLHLYCP